MYILKNALKSITRTKARNILIGIIIAVIATSCCIALSIKNSATKLIDSYKDSYDIEAKLTLNRESMRGDMKKQQGEAPSTTPQDFMSQVPEINMDMINSYGTSEYVKNYHYQIQTDLNAKDIEKVTSEIVSNGNIQMNMGRPGMESKENQKNTGDFSIIGYSSLDSMTNFINSDYKITSGAIFDMEDTSKPCIISEELAEENELSVGSKITMINPNNEEETYTFNVVGIYSDSTDDGEFSMFSSSANQIITNYVSLNQIFETSKANDDTKLNLQTDATFNLTSTDVIDSFKEELTGKGLSSYYTVTTNLESLDESISPIKNLSTFATTFLVMVLLIGGVILVVVNMINIRERKYEIGVLRCIGMKKGKVLSQFVIELFIVTFSSILLGTILGSVLSVPVANRMLESEISSTKESEDKINNNFGMMSEQGGKVAIPKGNNMPGAGDIRATFGNSDVEYIDKMNTVIDIKTVGQLVLIGIVLTLLSSSVSMIFISRYTPLKILSNRT